MTNVADALGAAGIRRPYEVVDLAQQVGLDLPIGCAMLKRESYGGLNLWGGDRVSTGGVYVKGTLVTRDSYLAYRDLRRRGIIGNQGVGPGQLTSTGYQDEADFLGGCWDWRSNVTVAFRALQNLIRVYGSDGIRRYNGSGPNAEEYRRAILADAASWARVIQGTDPVPVSPPHSTYKGEEMVIRCLAQNGFPNEDFGVGLLSGGHLIGLSGEEKRSALASGLPIVDVNVDTWNYLAAPANGGSPQ